MPCTTGNDAIRLLQLVLEGSSQSVCTVSSPTPPVYLNDFKEIAIWKTNGNVHITTDLTQLNLHVIPVRHPPPSIRDIRILLAGAKFFSRLDLTKAYYYIQLSEASRPLTATITPWGLYQYCRLPMGLKDSADGFQRCVEQTLSGVVGCVTYIVH